jgi:hypothetical protein
MVHLFLRRKAPTCYSDGAGDLSRSGEDEEDRESAREHALAALPDRKQF